MNSPLGTDTGPIIVGIDGSAPSDAALEWAVDEATHRHAPLHLLHSRGEEGWFGRTEEPDLADARRRQSTVLTTRMSRARQLAPELDLTSSISARTAAAALLERSRGATLMVLGGHSSDTVRRVLLGSVARQVAAHSPCPVVVVPDDSYRRPEHSGVVVGVDGSPGSAMALEFAFAHAADHEAELTAVHALWPGAGESVRRRPSEDEQAKDLLTDAVASLRAKFPEVRVREQIAQARAVDALVDLSATAELLVIGSRGAGGFRGLLLGSVGHRVLQHAHCPVAVVPSPRTVSW